MADWYIDNDIPFRYNFPELKVSTIDTPNEWVTDKERKILRFDEVPEWRNLISREDIWFCDDNIYYSRGSNHYVLNKATLQWGRKTWYGLSSFRGMSIWSDGSNVYYSPGSSSSQYVLNKSTSTWRKKTWYGFTSIDASNIWSDGSNVYYSYGSTQYILDIQTSTWTSKTWNGLTSFYGNYIWSDGSNVYYSANSAQYVLDIQTSTWTEKTWNGLTSFNGSSVWNTDGHIYCNYPNGTSHYPIYELNISTSTWEEIQWYSTVDIPGLTTIGMFGSDEWSVNNTSYFSPWFSGSGFNSYSAAMSIEWATKTPYRVEFPELKESINARHFWFIDDDVPFQGGFPPLKESQSLRDEWVSKKEMLPEDEYCYLKLTVPFTVDVTAGGDAFSISTPFPVSKTNYFTSVIRYTTRDCQISVKLPYDVMLYQYEFTKSNNVVSDMASRYFYLGPRTASGSGLAAYLETDYSDESYVLSQFTNTSGAHQQWNSYYGSYDCTQEFQCQGIQAAADSGSTDFTFGFIFRFDKSSDSDMANYDNMLEYYGEYIAPYHYYVGSVPYRLDFPDQYESIPGTDIWVSDGDIPFRFDFPPLCPSNGGLTSWLQNTGYDPYRPWPNHKTIFQSVPHVDIPEIDWTKSMQQDFEYFKVNPKSWHDTERIDKIISSNLTRDSDSEMRGHASIELSELIEECYIRTYMVVKQNNIKQRICLGTYLYIMSSDNFDGSRHHYTMTGYTPLIELREKLPPLGYYITGITGEINGRVAPMVSDEIIRLISQYTRLKLENRVRIEKPLLNNYVANTSDTLLTVVNALLNASSLQEYTLTLDERGTVCVKEAINTYNERHVWEYNDSNSSILLPDIDLSTDLSSIPNVLEVIYAGDANKDIGAIRVVVKNEDPNSVVSTVARGREVWARTTLSNLGTLGTKSQITREKLVEDVTSQAYKLLEQASTIRKTIQYSHGYCDVEVGDTVLFNYRRAGLTNVKAKVVSQTIRCKPGCQVDEMAVYTKKLWNRIRN